MKAQSLKGKLPLKSVGILDLLGYSKGQDKLPLVVSSLSQSY